MDRRMRSTFRSRTERKCDLIQERGRWENLRAKSGVCANGARGGCSSPARRGSLSFERALAGLVRRIEDGIAIADDGLRRQLLGQGMHLRITTYGGANGHHLDKAAA